MNESSARAIIQFGIDCISWCNNIFTFLCTPISELANIDLGDGLLLDLVETLFDAISSIISSTIGDQSIIVFCFGAGFVFWLIFSIFNFFAKVV